MKHIIRIIVTEGCIGCKIAENLVNKAIKEYSYRKVEIEIINHLDTNYKDFIKNYSINDYPTIIFIKNDEVMSIHTGTMAVPQLLHEIKLWFN